MNSVSLHNSTHTIPQNEDLTLSFNKYLTSTKQYINTGSWYGELSHINGNGYYYFGVKSDSDDPLYLYTEGSTQPKIWIGGCFRGGKSKGEKLPFLISYTNDVIGFGIDFNQKIYSICYNYTFYTFDIPEECYEKKFNYIVGGITSSYNEWSETVRVNFGDQPFKYKLTGIQPWEEKVKISCKSQYSYLYKAKIMIIVILI